VAILEEPIKGMPLVRNYIDGDWVESKGETRDVVNPATYQMIGKVPISTKEEIETAVEAAKAAFPDWRRTTPVARARCLPGRDEARNRECRGCLRDSHFDDGIQFRGYCRRYRRVSHSSTVRGFWNNWSL